ncbi:PIN domain-containing protein [Mycena vitilis]|nr:PIN domain-containing protein [Mycena vitilis]
MRHRRLSHLGLLQQFVRDVEKKALGLLVIIPGAVLNELDGQKKSDRLGWFARRASEWIFEKVKERRSGKRSVVRGQTEQETCRASGNWKIRQRGETFGERENDALIMDCCMYFASKFRTALCSADKNLCIESESRGIRSITPKSGHDVAQVLFGQDADAFAPYEADYTGIESIEEEGMMDIDEEVPRLTHQQAMNRLHVQIIDHFTRLLVALVGRVGPELEDVASDGGVTASQHAPKWVSGDTPYREWSARECLEYLNRKKRIPETYPRLETFLTKPYANGARPGSQWSYEAWATALSGLKQIGEVFAEPSIVDDLEDLTRHREAVFGLGR